MSETQPYDDQGGETATPVQPEQPEQSVESGSQAAVQSPAEAAAAAIGAAQARVQVTTGGGPGAVLPESKFPRLSVQRRVLAHISDEVDETEFGPRNTLASLTRALMTDRNTINPPTSDHGKLDVNGKTVVEIAQQVLDHLEELIAAGLVEQHDDETYRLTDAGHAEINDGQQPHDKPTEDEHGRTERDDGVWRSDEEQQAHEEAQAKAQQAAQAQASAEQTAADQSGQDVSPQ